MRYSVEDCRTKLIPHFSDILEQHVGIYIFPGKTVIAR